MGIEVAMDVIFDVSPVFSEIRPGLGDQEVRSQLSARAGERGQSPSTDQMDALASEYEKAAQLLATSGVVYAATCLGRLNGDLSTGTLTLALSPLAYKDPEVAVEGIRLIMAREHGQSAEVETLSLPCGEAAIVIRQIPALQIPAELTKSGKDIPIDFAQLQAFIPVPQSSVPGAQTLATVTFSTPSIDHWADYSELLTEFLQSLRFSSGEGMTGEPPAPAEPSKGTATAFG